MLEAAPSGRAWRGYRLLKDDLSYKSPREKLYGRSILLTTLGMLGQDVADVVLRAGSEDTSQALSTLLTLSGKTVRISPWFLARHARAIRQSVIRIGRVKPLALTRDESGRLWAVQQPETAPWRRQRKQKTSYLLQIGECDGRLDSENQAVRKVGHRFYTTNGSCGVVTLRIEQYTGLLASRFVHVYLVDDLFDLL